MGTATGRAFVPNSMILPLLAPSQTSTGGFVPVEARFPDASLAVVTVSGLRFLIDSGCPRTLVRRDRIGRDGTLALPGSAIRLRPQRLAPSELERPSRYLGADGILGNDALRQLCVLIDYRNRRVFMRAAEGAALADALRASGRNLGRREIGATTELPIAPDGEGWYRTSVVPGERAAGAIWDTGASSYAVAGTRAELGPRLGSVGVQGFDRDSRRPVHLARLDLPGTDPIPVLGFRRPVAPRGEAEEPATIGPYTLTEEWSYLDEARGRAIVPRPTAEGATRRALAGLLRLRALPTRLDETTRGVFDDFLRIGEEGGLDRARRSALRLVRDADDE